MATITRALTIPARCWIAPEIPTAMYSWGATLFPVWPTWNDDGRQPASVTAREAPTAAPSAAANSSTRGKLSAERRPRPPETTIEASRRSGPVLPPVGSNVPNVPRSASARAAAASGAAGGGNGLVRRGGSIVRGVESGRRGVVRHDPPDDRGRSEATREPRDLAARGRQRSPRGLPDDDDRPAHGNTFASSFRRRTSSRAASSGFFASMSFAPVRGGGSRNAVADAVGPRGTPSEAAAIFSIGDFRDLRMFGSFAVLGSFHAC